MSIILLPSFVVFAASEDVPTLSSFKGDKKEVQFIVKSNGYYFLVNSDNFEITKDDDSYEVWDKDGTFYSWDKTKKVWKESQSNSCYIKSSDFIIESTHNLKLVDGTVFFSSATKHLQLGGKTITIPPTIMKTLVSLLVLLIPCLVLWIGLRKALAMLSTLLHRA